MGKIAFLYPGQGSQKVGMGKGLLQRNPLLFERYLGQSDQITGEMVSQYCLEGPSHALNQTYIAQPALFAYSLALTEYANRLGLNPDMVAGYSLGEYTAAVAAGAISFDEGLSLVCERGRLLRQLQDEQPGAMAAVFGMEKEDLDPFCREISRRVPVMVAGCDAPELLIISGTEKGVQQLIEVIRKQDKGKVIRLPVKGALHSPLMKKIQGGLCELARGMSWCDATIPLVANTSGSLLMQGADIHKELVEQITRPVQWITCVERLVASGCDTLVELGSGQILTKLAYLIVPRVTLVAIDTPEKLEAFVKTRRPTFRQRDLQVAA